MQNTQNMSIKYESHDFDITNKNPLFSEAKVYVMYHGDNRNNTHISKDSVENALQSLYNIPIVGEFVESEDSEEKNNFGSHGGKVVIDDNGIKYIHTTRPVGVVPESARVYWEVLKDEKDREREYLVVEGALIWNRYETEVNTLKSANFGQSMEIEVLDGQFDDEEGIFHINEFSFSAFCILGIDGRENGKVEPAFEDSKIITYSKDAIVTEFKEMKDELKEYYASYSERKEENEVDLEKDKNLEEELNEENVTDKTDDKKSDDKKEESETIQTLEEGVAGQVITEDDEPEKKQGTSGDVEGADDATIEDAETIADANTETETVENTEETSDARVIADENTEPNYEVKYNEVKDELDALKDELKELREFKENADKEEHGKKAVELFESIGLEEEDINEIDIYEYSIDELEEKAYAILGKKLANGKKEFSADKEVEKKTNRVDLSQASKEKKTNKYGNLFAKYGK